MSIEPAPRTTLTNGVRIVNFSSPHWFTFRDGSILPACSSERANHYSLEEIEDECPHYKFPTTDIFLSFRMTDRVRCELFSLITDEETDIILVPLPVMTAWKNDTGRMNMVGSKIRTVRMHDRVSKIACHDRFCV